MTPNEKAIQLLKKYIHICERWNESYVEEKPMEYLRKELHQNQWFIPKNCAINTVNELIENCPIEKKQYWIDVRIEINSF